MELRTPLRYSRLNESSMVDLMKASMLTPDIRRTLTTGLVLLLFAAAGGFAADPLDPAVNKWEPSIRAFEEADREHPPAPGQILFIGSSSIRRWDLAKSFPDLDVLNRGFGGSQTADAVHFFDRIVPPYRPRIVVLYAGDNDLAQKKTPRQVADDVLAFRCRLCQTLPEARLIYISIKPSLKRWNLISQVREANALIKCAFACDPRASFLDIDAAMLGPDGLPRPELFVEDGLHLSEEGYKLWSDQLRPLLTP